MRDRYDFTEGFQGSFRGWAYIDFAAGAITTTSVTITANENGTDLYGFDSTNIISNSAVCVRADYPARKAYTGLTALFSTKVAVSAHTGVSVTLSGVPHSNWGDIRIYYFYSYVLGVPQNYTIPSKAVAENLFAELQDLMITEEELGDGSKDAVFNSIENTPIGASTPSSGNFTDLSFTGSIGGTVDHTTLSNIGSNTHDQIDAHLVSVNEHIDWTDATADFLTTGGLSVGGDTAVGGGLTVTGTIDSSSGKIRIRDDASSKPQDEADGYISIYESGATRRFYTFIGGERYYVTLTADPEDGIVPATGNPQGLWLFWFTYTAA